VIVENRPGANGIIVTQQVATAKPNSYTLLHTNGSLIGNMGQLGAAVLCLAIRRGILCRSRGVARSSHAACWPCHASRYRP
jgi:hypothetical protein